VPIEARKCTPCGRVYELLFFKRQGYSALCKDDIDDLTCPDCDSAEYTPHLHVGIGVELGGEAGATSRYPRSDKGLGCIVRDAAHHRWLMKHHPNGEKRDIPLQPAHGENVLDFYEKQWSASERRQKAAAEQKAKDAYLNREVNDKVARLIADNMEALKKGQDNIFTRGRR
jgi:hypothetical protein